MSVVFEIGQEFEMELPGGRYKAIVEESLDVPESRWVIKVIDRVVENELGA